ncbi:MAG TPA: hypothetical protein VGB92_12640 [Longimicrobium sp.]|jgi:hypothetical protein
MSASQLAALIADALVDAGLVPRERFEDAAHITEAEIEVRLALGNEIVPGRDSAPPE